MDPQLIIEKYQNAIIQIATASGTGTGFYVKEFDLIVTNDHVVAENSEVTIAGKTFDKALSRSGTPIGNMTWPSWKRRKTLSCRSCN